MKIHKKKTNWTSFNITHTNTLKTLWISSSEPSSSESLAALAFNWGMAHLVGQCCEMLLVRFQILFCSNCRYDRIGSRSPHTRPIIWMSEKMIAIAGCLSGARSFMRRLRAWALHPRQIHVGYVSSSRLIALRLALVLSIMQPMDPSLLSLFNAPSKSPRCAISLPAKASCHLKTCSNHLGIHNKLLEMIEGSRNA